MYLCVIFFQQSNIFQCEFIYFLLTVLTSNPFVPVAVCEQPEQVADAAGEDQQQLQQVLHLHLPGDRGRGQPGPRHRPRQGGG